MAHRRGTDAGEAHSYLDLGAALDTLLKGAGHELLGILSLRQVAARLGRGLRVAVVLPLVAAGVLRLSTGVAMGRRMVLGEHHGAVEV
jgi:hypothetical protein